MRAAWWMAGVLWLGALPMAAAAQERVTLPAGTPYVHRPSGLSVPAVLDGAPRTTLTKLVPDLDEYVNFASADEGEQITIYVYRLVAGSIPVWFDRTVFAMEHRPEVYRGMMPIGPVEAFAPPGQTSASGLRQVYGTSGEFRSTAAAMMPLGREWIVNVRYSSRTLTPAVLREHLGVVVEALGWPKIEVAQPAAEPVAACASALALRGEAKAVKARPEDALGAALMAAAASLPADEKKAPTPSPPATWCRDTSPLPGMGMSAVYRANGDTGIYLLAFNDAGRAISAVPNTLGAMLGKGKPSWVVQLHDMARTLSYAPLDRLPPPAQATGLLRTAPMSSTTTWGKQREVTLDGRNLK